MNAARVAAAVLVAAGVLICVGSSLGALRPRSALGRLHFVTPVTSLAAPLIGTGLAVDAGWHPTAALIVVTVLILAITGPVLAAATARATAQLEGLVPAESPE